MDIGFYLRPAIIIVGLALVIRTSSKANKSGVTWVFRQPLIVVMLFAIAFYLSMSVYPIDSFYKKEFETNTELPFPKSGRIIEKGATFPDQHGDYTSYAVIKVAKEDYKDMISEIKADRKFAPDTSSTNYFLIDDSVFKNSIEQRFTGIRRAWFRIGFLKDQTTFFFERHSS